MKNDIYNARFCDFYAQAAESSLDSANQNNPSLRADSANRRGNPPLKISQNLAHI